MATNNLLQLTALAVQGGRQLVVPFVKDSLFHGVPTSQGHHTLELYYNIVALNESLRLHSHGTLINWDRFQDVCKGKLDVLVYFHYTNLTNFTTNNLSTPYNPCKRVNANSFNSVQRFEDEILKRLPCVGIFEWRGARKTNPKRTHFDIESKVEKLLS